MNENIRKTLLYFQPIETYWRTSDPADHRFFKESKIGLYPLSFRDRITQGHYPKFDHEGIPVFPLLKGGRDVHFYTGMCSYSFGNWELYLLSGKEQYARQIIVVADFILRTAIHKSNGVAVLLDFDDETETTGITCAMNNGEALSVLARAWELNGRQEYLALGLKLAKALNFPYGSDGLNGRLSNGELWYLEGGKYILNGHIYTLFGLYEFNKVCPTSWVEELFQKGIESLVNSLSKFNAGYWSWYWINKPSYLASIMYHNLHICQLTALGQLTGKNELQQWADTFRQQSGSPINRIFAAGYMVQAKIKKLM